VNIFQAMSKRICQRNQFSLAFLPKDNVQPTTEINVFLNGCLSVLPVGSKILNFPMETAESNKITRPLTPVGIGVNS
jgi:hypothetical protein